MALTPCNTSMQSQDLDVAELESLIGVGTCVSNAVTINAAVGQVTTESLTTAAGATQAITVNNALVQATDAAFVQQAGGTNTTKNLDFRAVCTAGVLTVSIDNNTAATAINGTVIFNFIIVHARPGSVL